MAKKLLVGSYRFDASEKTVYCKGNIAGERFLVITNITSNTIIYNFADPTAGYAGVSYDSDDDETALGLLYDTTSMSDTDILQIFVQGDYQEITPAEDILDPVGKLRVSNPENLIDTDFEYGLQATKWETIQTVNNIPTIYSNSGDTPIDGIVSVDAVSGSRNIKVTTNIPHGLSIGDPISVQGVSQYQAEGYFIVTNVPNTLEFYFELDVVATFSGDISGSYTSIIPGKFFEGSTLPVSTADGATTDGATPSTISVTTENTHGFSQNTKVYLRNTVGPRTLVIADSTLTAPDGRPYVDTVPSFNTTTGIALTTDTGRGTYKKTPVVTYDWEGTYSTYLASSDVNATNDTITWNGHNLRDRYALLFQTPYQGLSDAGLTDGTVYYVEVVDANTIKLHTNTALAGLVNLTNLVNDYGLARLTLCYKIESASGTSRRTTFGDYYITQTQPVQAPSGGVGSNSTGVVTYQIDLTAAGLGNPTNVTIDRILLGGDVDTSGEWVEFTIAGTTQRIYSPGNQSPTLGTTAAQTGGTPVFNGLDASSALSLSGGSTILTVQASCSGSVGTFVYGSDRYRFAISISPSGGSFTDAEKSRSGGDLNDAPWGLGATQPNSIVAFQGVTPNNYSNTNDGFSSLQNQQLYGRYGTFSVRNPSQSVSSTPTQTGAFDINYNNINSSFGTGSEIFYVFCNTLSADRNTIYIGSHGITGNQNVTVTVDPTFYASGDRFGYTNTTVGTTDMPNSFQAVATPVNTDIIRLSTSQSPNTDDITRVPQEFTISYITSNTTFNSLYVANHKITGDVTATYTNTSGSAIGGLTSGQSIDLQRLDDSRLQLANTGVNNTATIQQVIERSNNSVVTEFIDLETALTFAPGTAEITQLEFRGDFSAGSEYVTLEILDSGGSTVDTYVIGQFDDSGDTATYTTSTTFPTGGNYDISNILHNNGGATLGITVRITPQAAVNFGPGGGPWWGLRFTVLGEEQGFVLTGPGSGGHTFDVASVVGAYDGVFNIATIPAANQFTMDGTFKIPLREYSFTSTNINAGASTIQFGQSHNLITGEKITYNANGNTSILPAGVTDTFVIVVNSTTIKLATSALDALNNASISITSQTGTHTLSSDNVIKNIQGPGNVTIVQNSRDVTGSGSAFLTQFKRFDKIYINNGSYVESYTVDTISTNENMTLFESSSANASAVDYYYATQLALRPDGYSLHKPFDGGVDITAGTSPTSRIARQTRKYFRYQSGKGLQTSFAINFNPPKLVKELIKATGTTATIDTQEQHNLQVGDIITIAGATVSTGTNYYNGTFTIASTPTPFQFTYTMLGTPTDVRASGFPTYVRQSWTDSFVRGGMFDDQNGFFFEYDGQNLYAVRRSSTKQIAGDITVTRGSQIVNGDGTSFTTQLTIGDKVVIRGQSYLITEISSDIRMIVQPAYRGINATRVKATKTIDTKTPQSQWNMDKGDGTGFTGYILDTTKIQMAYMDYSWYGAGKIRYGFKDNVGHVRYFHEYRHNNRLDESYFRSGNLPARYEIENGANSSTSPTLFHFGTSIIMDGTFDDDKAYQFTGQSRPFAFTSGGNANITSSGNSTFSPITLDGNRVYVYTIPVSQVDAESVTVGDVFNESTPTNIPTDSYITQVDVDGANSKIYVNYPATTADPTGGTEYSVIAGSTVFTVGETSSIELQRPIPLISVRLAPSVDSGLTGTLGERDIVNRMQLRLAQASVTANKNIELFLIQNTLPSRIAFQKAQSPSLSQIIKHVSGDTLLAGTTIYSSKVSAGSASVNLSDLLEIGNSILGGDGIFPAGPDLLTLAVQVQDATGITYANPFTVSGSISWSESQA